MEKKINRQIDGLEYANDGITYGDDFMQSVLPELEAAQETLDHLHQHLNEQQVQMHGGFCEKGLVKSSIAIESMTEGVVMVSEDGTIEMANLIAKKLLGLDEAGSLRNVEKAMENIGLKHLLVARQQPFSKSESEFIGKTSVGKVLQIKWSAIIDDERRFVGNVVVIRDVTAQIELDKAQTEFISAISHELRTPLTTIKNSVSNMLAGTAGKITPKMGQYLGIMHSDCQRLGRLINDLLDMAKLEAGRMSIIRNVTNLVEIADKAALAFSSSALEKGIKLELVTNGCISRVYVDSQRIYQVLSNLLTNAIKYTAKDGSITISLFERKEEIEAVVADTGIGIAEQHLRYIFNKFYQISRQAGPGYNGSGLGLSLSNEIIAAHDGRMWVESKPGKGSKFHFSLPKTAPQVMLDKHLKTLAGRNIQKGERFAMMVVRLVTSQEYAAKNQMSFEGAMRQIMCEIDKISQTSGDLAVQSGDIEAVIVLSQTGKRYLMHIKRTLQTIVCNAMKNHNCDFDAVVPMASVTLFPNDASTVEALKNKAMSELNRLS